MSFEFLTGRENKFLKDLETNGTTLTVHQEIIPSFLKLKKHLEQFNINLSLVSGFRSFDHQLKIWNAKARGERVLYDKEENELIYKDLSPNEIMHAILRWSALPGASRHHWGSDIDIYDHNIKTKKEVDLTLNECQQDFKELYSQIDPFLNECGFYRPYDKDRGGVSPEPWHLSFKSLSQGYLEQYTIDFFKKSVSETQGMLLKDEVLNNLEELYHTYIINVCA